MAYWLCITTEKNWNVIREKNVWGVSERHKNVIAKVKPGDKLVIYIKQERVDNVVKEPRIVGVFEVVSDPFKDSTRIFSSKGVRSSGETFPWRVKIKPIKIFDKPIEFKPLIPKLKFITNKKKWTGHLMGRSMREIPEEDYNLILRTTKH
ncbi:EVE domain-containing protein [Archaeoglobus sp.]